MAFIDDIKTALRIKATAYDTEITDLISAAQADLQLSGILPEKVVDTTDSLVKRAISIYCKANFGLNNPDAEKYGKSYDMLKTHLALSAEYTEVTL